MANYAHPETLVSTDWVQENLGRRGVKLVEVDVDTKAYDAGHIEGAIGFNWQTQLQDQLKRDILSKSAFEKLLGGHGIANSGTVRTVAELKKIYFENAHVDGARPTIAYCRIGERSSHTWFVLRYLLGLDQVRNYDGSWTEYGSMIGLPIERLEPQPAGA